MRRPAAVLIVLSSLAGWTPGDDPRGDERAPAAPAERFSDEQRAHWAYQPIARPDPPDVRDQSWARNPMDRFVLSGLEEMGFRHAPEAERLDLIRRVTYDLTGLPPTPVEIDAFLADARPDAYERLVDRLLASPHFGERWAQHWLDLAHYADTNGFELDADRPDAWRYRDWVVGAFNQDMNYDRFVMLQIAGDEAEPGVVDALIATGFGRCGPREVVAGNIDPEVRRQSELTEVTGTVGSVFLGLTLGCARCHDHKFDALPTTDYYRLQAFFAGAAFVDQPIATKDEDIAFAAAKKAVNVRIAPLSKRLAELEAPYRESLRKQKEAMLRPAERAVLMVPEADRTPIQKKLAEGVKKALSVTWEEVAEAVQANPADHAERERLKRAIHDIEVTLPPLPARAMALFEPKPEAPETFVLLRGDVKHKGARVEPRPPGIVLAMQPDDAFGDLPSRDNSRTTGRRLALARWLTRPDNPLAARVIVNRLWQHHVGRGIVATPSDFGVRGEPPSHPELLDWLASELIAGGWRLKPIHRLIVTSAAYRQSSRFHNAQQASDDPENQLIWRMNRRRLDAEALRDALLAATGELNAKMGGPGVRPPIEKEIEDLIFTEAEVVDLWPETPDPAEHARRALYLHRKRNVRYPMFDAFDAPDTQIACPRRESSTHALQPLILLNSAFAIDRAKTLAGRVLCEASGIDERVTSAYRRVLGRAPRPDEAERARAFLAGQETLLRRLESEGQPLAKPTPMPPDADPAEAAAWVDFALSLLNCNEFVYMP
jgi:hypothetical protein